MEKKEWKTSRKLKVRSGFNMYDAVLHHTGGVANKPRHLDVVLKGSRRTPIEGVHMNYHKVNSNLKLSLDLRLIMVTGFGPVKLNRIVSTQKLRKQRKGKRSLILNY